MAISQLGTATSLAWTADAGGSEGAGPTSPLTSIQSYNFSRNKELAEFILGQARVKSHYSSTKSAEITVESADLSKTLLFEVGQKYTNVILTVSSALDSDVEAPNSGTSAVITLTAAIVSAVGEISHGNEDDAPAVQSVTFTLSRFPEASADPSWTIA